MWSHFQAGTLVRRLQGIMGRTSGQDGRGRRVIAVIECILNQNARDAGAARSPAMNRDVVRLCEEFDVGFLQMPCPEIAFLGSGRTRRKGESIREALETTDGRRCCARISGRIADRVEEYVRQGNQVLAVLGGNPASPGCAVHQGASELLPLSGVFMRELQAELRRRSIEIPFRGMRDNDSGMMVEDLEWLRGVLSTKAGATRDAARATALPRESPRPIRR